MELSLELQSNQYTRTVTKIVEQVTQFEIDTFSKEQAVDGWTVKSWAAKEVLPFDEGFSEAKVGKPIEANPYAEHYWKNNEWSKGWDFFHEND